MKPSYDRRIQILRRATVQDATYLTETVTWTTFATVWASIQDMLPSRADRVPEGISLSSRPARIRLRYIGGITNDMRIRAGDQLFQIVAGPAQIGGRQRDLEIVGQEITTTGEAR